jgi:hypothetical protein
VTSYGPGGRSAIEKRPCPSEIVLRAIAVAVLVAVTVTPGRTAPELSTTVPRSVPPTVCAADEAPTDTHNAIQSAVQMRRQLAQLLILVPPRTGVRAPTMRRKERIASLFVVMQAIAGRDGSQAAATGRRRRGLW